MALPKKQLRAKLIENGITDETALAELLNWILEANSASLDGLREQLEEANKKANESDSVKANLESTKKELEELKKASGDASKIQKDFDDYKAAITAEKANALKDKLIRKELANANANPKAIDLLMRAVDLSSIELENDALKNAEKALAPLKENYSDFFGKDGMKGTPPINPPSGGGNAISRESILSIKDATERQKAISEHMELFTKK